MSVDDQSTSVEYDIVIGGPKSSFVALHLRPDGASVKVCHAGFVGKLGNVFLGPRAWRSFVKDMACLEKSRMGTAEIESYEDDFRLKIYATDRAGHMAAEAHLDQPGVETSLRVLFELDPTTLPGIVRTLTGMTWRGPAWLPN